MRLSRRNVAFAGALALGTSGLRRKPCAAIAQSGEEAAVNQAIEALRKAMVDADKARLEELVADQLSYGHSAGMLGAKRNSSASSPARRQSTSRSACRSPAPLLPATTLSCATSSRHKTEADGKTGSVRVGMLQVWQHQDGPEASGTAGLQASCVVGGGRSSEPVDGLEVRASNRSAWLRRPMRERAGAGAQRGERWTSRRKPCGAARTPTTCCGCSIFRSRTTSTSRTVVRDSRRSRTVRERRPARLRLRLCTVWAAAPRAGRHQRGRCRGDRRELARVPRTGGRLSVLGGHGARVGRRPRRDAAHLCRGARRV